MKKCLCFLLGLNVLFICTTWAQNAIGKRKYEFRHQILADLARGEGAKLEIALYVDGYPRDLGRLNLQTAKSVLARIDLVKSRPDARRFSSRSYLQFSAPSGDCFQQSGFVVSLDGKQSSIESGGDYALGWGQEWRGIELTPQSRRALRDFVISHYGPQIESLQARKSRNRQP